MRKYQHKMLRILCQRNERIYMAREQGTLEGVALGRRWGTCENSKRGRYFYNSARTKIDGGG